MDEYNLASGGSSYLLNSQYFWTTTPNSASTAWSVFSDGRVNSNAVSDANGVRPVIMIGPDVQILDGNGSYDNPYEI